MTDDRGIDVPQVPTSKAALKASTNADGTAIYDSVEPGSHTVALETLTQELLLDFEEFKGEPNRSVTVAPGQIAYVPYQLARKPALKVRVEKKATATPLKLFGGARVTTKGADALERTTQEQTGIADFLRVKAGDYAVQVALKKEHAEEFATTKDFTKESEGVALAPGQEREIVVTVEAINFVAGKAEITKNKTLFLDDDPNDDDSTGTVVLSLVQTNPEQKYMKEMRFKCTGPDEVEASLKDAPWVSLGALKDGVQLQSAERDALRDGGQVTLYLRGKTTAGDFDVSLELDDPQSRFVKPGKAVAPDKGTIQIVARPQFKILWTDTDKGVKDVVVSLGAETVPTSDDDGLAKWLKRGIRPGEYKPTFTFSGGVKYLLHDESGQPVDGEPKVDLQHRGRPFTFKIKKTNVTLKAMCETGGKPAEEMDAKITVNHASELTLKKGDGAKRIDIPIVEKNQKCLIQKLEPDVPTDVYEFVGVETL